MINVKNLTKCYGNNIILDNLNFNLPDKGFVVMFGDSGSGKSTLLNCIGGVDREYHGEILINNTNIATLSEKENCNYRINHIGYVFQNFNLFNLESAYENIKLPLDCIAILDEKYKRCRTNDVIKFLDIKKIKNTKVNVLSGGEKQRVAIGRAIINSPDVILCDEPTGALDEKNSRSIYELLKRISTERLVLIATHDLDAKFYGDIVLNLADGKINSIEKKKTFQKTQKFNLIGGRMKRKKVSLPLRFKIDHALNKIKSKKWRSLITNGILSLSLSGIGISVLISSGLLQKINATFSSLFNGNQIVMSLIHDNQNPINSVYSATKEKVNEIADKYNEYIEGIGATYVVNFENFFKDQNDFYIPINGFKHIINSLSCRSINDFKWIDADYTNLTYPYVPSKLEDDEVVLGLSYIDMVDLCYDLQIQRSYASLGEYLRKNQFQLCLEVANFSWRYDDEQIFNVVAVTESNRSCFYHYNMLWNEQIFEKSMMLPSDDDNESYYPWEMHKIFYFKTIGDAGNFIEKAIYDSELYDFVFERTSYDYNPNLCKIGEICKENRVLIYYADKYSINPFVIKKAIELEDCLESYFFITDYGYTSMAGSLLSGFSKNVFVSTDLAKNEEAIDAFSYLNGEQNIEIKLSDDIAHGNFLQSLKGGIKFSSKYSELVSGRKPNNLNEIVISSSLAQKIGIDENKRELYFSSVVSENYLSDGKIEQKYQTVKLIVTGIVEKEKPILYHNSDWSISFFRDQLGVSMFLLTPKSVVFELDEKIDADKICSKFNLLFKNYKFECPITEISKSSSNTLNFANTILISFSIISSIVSILLLGTIVMLNVHESKDEIALFTYLGINKKDINSTFLIQSIIHGLISFILSSIEIIFIDIVINVLISNQFMVSISFSFNPLPLVVIFLFSIFITSITSLVSIKLIRHKKR